MSRFTNFLIGLLYVAGSMLTGYAGFALRILAEQNGLSADQLLAFAGGFPVLMVGPILLLVAVWMHIRSVRSARIALTMYRGYRDALGARVKSLNDILDRKNEQMSWVESAIQRAVRDNKTPNMLVEAPPKDYSDKE